ncbi:MAG: peptidase S10 [Betaproteobacteria bacterium]
MATDKKEQESATAAATKASVPAVIPTDRIVTTKHKTRINGENIAYTVTCGTVVLKEDSEKDGNREAEKPLATMFFIAYTRDGVKDPAKRPLTFSFNGGPGSSSVWLHIGVLGPKRVALDANGNAPPPPYKLVDNEYSLLSETDLVFIDPVGTGYSRMLDGEKTKEFHRYQRDLDSVGEFIRLYTSRNERWASPKFIAGESYGTTRAAGLSSLLQEKYSMYLNGLILFSTALDFSTFRFMSGHDLAHVLFLPTYAATAWYHQKLDKRLQGKSLRALLDEVEAFAEGDYNAALFLGDKLPPAQRDAIAGKLVQYTGLSREYLLQTNLRVHIQRYCKELCRDEHRTVGRLDSRFKGIDKDAAGETFEFDPAHTNLDGAYSACINDYLRRELKFESDTPYTMISRLYMTWDFGSKDTHLNVAENLRKAISSNPNMKVYVGSGYYDLATPHFASDYVLNHMALDPSLSSNISKYYYEAGHMMYVHIPSLKAQAKHLRDFVKKSI